MEDRKKRGWRVALKIALVLLAGIAGFAAWWLNRSVVSVEPVAPATSFSTANSGNETATGRPDAEKGQAESRHAVTESIEQPPEVFQRPTSSEPRTLSGFEVLVRDLRHDIEKLHELRLYGTGLRIVNRAVYLREDLLGNSLSMDEPLPKGWLDRHESYTAFAGPNGGHVYSFSREEYPLFYEMMERQDQEYAAVLEYDLIERITLFAEDAITLSGIPPK